MTRAQIRDLMGFVTDTQRQAIFDVVMAEKLNLNDKQMNFLISVLETKTKDCFFRMMEKTEK